MQDSPASPNPRVFISYSHDSDEHIEQVLAFANRLISEGIEVHVDKYEDPPPEGWPMWMERQIAQATFVLIICSEVYLRRVEGKEERGKGQGIKWESVLTFQEIYDNDSKNSKFIPVLLKGGSPSDIPSLLKATSRYDCTTWEGYIELYRRITDKPFWVPPVLGPVNDLPQRQAGRLTFPEDAATPIQIPQKSQPQGKLWNISHDRNQVFTGRNEVLNDLRADLLAQSKQVIYGLGGIGKTQIAVEYAYRYRENYVAVFWVFADSAQSISTDFIKIAKMLDLVVQDMAEQAVIVGAVKRWLEANDGWLLVFDNVENADIVRPFLPQGGRGHVLLTSRGHAYQSIGVMNAREIKVLPPEAALEFLLRRTNRNSLGANYSSEEPEGAQLAKELGFFPLALEQAAAFIAENQTSFGSYLKSYRNRRLELLSQQAPVLGEYKDTIATTWSLNFAEVEKFPASADLLRFSAFLWPEMIPLELFEKAAGELGGRLSAHLSSLQDDPLQLDQLLKPLTDYSLISRNPNTRSYSIHLLVQEVLKNRMSETEARSWVEAVIRAISAAFPEGEFTSWPECQRLLSQALVCYKYIVEWGFESEAAASLLLHAGLYLHHRAQLTESEAMYRIALAIRKKLFGEENCETANALNKLGCLVRDQAHFVEAELLLRQALKVREKILGLQHPATASGTNDLGIVNIDLGRYEEAEVLLRRALSLREAILHPRHIDLAESQDNLANLLRDLGEYGEAEPLARNALAIREKTFGFEHPSTGSSMNNVAAILVKLGKSSEAEPLYRRSLEINERILGPEHPVIATCLNNLAMLLRSYRKYSEAEPLYFRAIAIDEKALGPEHPETATDIANLAVLYQAQNKYTEAELLFRRALEIREKTLGSDHPRTANALGYLAGNLTSQGMCSEAEPRYRRALAIQLKVFDPKHPEIAHTLLGLASLHRKLGNNKKAKGFEQRARKIQRKRR